MIKENKVSFKMFMYWLVSIDDKYNDLKWEKNDKIKYLFLQPDGIIRMRPVF